MTYPKTVFVLEKTEQFSNLIVRDEGTLLSKEVLSCSVPLVRGVGRAFWLIRPILTGESVERVEIELLSLPGVEAPYIYSIRIT